MACAALLVFVAKGRAFEVGYQTTDTLPFQSEAGDLILGRDGKMYGSLRASDPATTGDRIVRLTESGKAETVHVLGPEEGARISGDLIFGGDGNLYGLTEAEGTNGGVFRIEPATGRFASLATFPSGYKPGKRLKCIGPDGELYGFATTVGGIPTIFRCTREGKVSVFTNIKAAPLDIPLSEPAALICGRDGNLYGTCLFGGSTGGERTYGALFKVVPTGQVSLIHPFNQITGRAPTRIVQGSDLAIYALTERVNLQLPQDGTAKPYSSQFLRITLSGIVQTLKAFPARRFPADATLTMGVFPGSEGHIFAIRPNETSPEPLMLFRYDGNGNFQDYLRFSGNAGSRPGGPLQIDISGTLRGIAATTALQATQLFKVVNAFPPIDQLPPIARDDFFNTGRRSRILDVLNNDSEDAVITSTPDLGNGTLSVAADGRSIAYRPGQTSPPFQSFRYTISNPAGTATAVVHLRRAYPGAVYAGLIPGTNGTGLLRAAISRSGAVTGKLSLAGRDILLRGAMGMEDTFETTTNLSVSNGSGGYREVAVRIVLAPTPDRSAVNLSIRYDAGSLSGLILQVAGSGMGNEGVYHAALPPTNNHPAALRGSGYARVIVGKTGNVRALGRLADGKRFSLFGYVTRNDAALVFSTMYVAKHQGSSPQGGMLGGALKFDRASSPSSLQASLRWTRANYNLKAPDERMVLTQPLKGGKWIPGFSLTNVGVSDNNIGRNAIARLRNVDGSVTTTNATLNGESFTADAWELDGYMESKQGLVLGTFRDPLTGAQRVFGGLVLPSEARAFGLFISRSKSGTVEVLVR